MSKDLIIRLKFGLNNLKQNVTNLKKNILYAIKTDKIIKENNYNSITLFKKKSEIAINIKPKVIYKANNFKSVVISRKSINEFKFKSIFIYLTCRSKSEKVVQLHTNKKVLEQWVQSKYNKNTKKFHKLIDIILDIEFLQKCYFYIKSKPSNLIPSSDSETLDGISIKWLTSISSKIKNNTYMPKFTTTQNRWLVINSSIEKIMQEGIRQILSTIYEQKFSNYSYGFRQGKNIHYCLRFVKNWKDVSWFISLDIEKYFDTINKKLLISIIKKDIRDQRFFYIINKLFNNNISEMNLKTRNLIQGLSQASILSPILSNIYLNKFDIFMEKVIVEFNKGKEFGWNQKFKRMVEFRRSCENKTFSKKNKRLRQARNLKIISTNFENSTYVQIKYARYVDDFIIGISGNKILAHKIMNKVQQFLKSKLHLKISEKKNSLISIVHRQVFFLGFLLKKMPKYLNPVISQKLKGKEKRARVLKRLKHECFQAEQRELKKIKSHLKIAIAKSLSKKYSSKGYTNNIINNIAQIIQKERSKNLYFKNKTFFSESTLKTILYANKFDIPKKILNSFYAFNQTVKTNLECVNKEISNAKIKWKFINESRQENKIITKQTDLLIQIYAPSEIIKQKLKTKGIISKKGKPQALNFMIQETDSNIFNWYSFLAKGIINYYRCADNFHKVKGIINYQIKWSIYHTLAKKYKTSIRKLINKYGDDFRLNANFQNIFPSKFQIAGIKKTFLIKRFFSYPFDTFNKVFLKEIQISFDKCSVENCKNIDIKIYHVHKLEIKIAKWSMSVKKIKKWKLENLNAYLISKNRIQISLCHNHYNMIHQNKLLFEKKKKFDFN